jgi:hypothetical protein
MDVVSLRSTHDSQGTEKNHRAADTRRATWLQPAGVTEHLQVDRLLLVIPAKAGGAFQIAKLVIAYAL